MKYKQKLTKSIILDNIAQEDIFAKYLEIDVKEITFCTETNTKICNPLRDDKHASLGFRYVGKGRLRAKDFAGFFWGDCFDLVAHVRRLNISDSQSFNLVLEDIADVFGLFDNEVKEIRFYKKIMKHKAIIDVARREWNTQDVRYWGLLNAEIQILKYYKVFPVYQYWINKYSQPKEKYTYNVKDPCYAYFQGLDGNKIEDIKLYFPMRDKKGDRPKFITNYSKIEGTMQLRGYDTLLITKSYKDVIAIINNWYLLSYRGQYPIDCISLASENTYPTKEELELIHTYKYKYSLMDYDKTGKVMANRLYKQEGIIPIFLTDGTNDSFDYKAKDFSDYVTNNNISKVKEIISETIECFEENE